MERTGEMTDERRAGAFWLTAASWGLVLSSLIGIGYILIFAGRGLDFSDEGMYLNAISHPFLYGTGVTQYGYFYYPLYLLLDGDITALRQSNLAINALLGAALCYLLARRDRLVFAAIGALLAQLPLQMWLATPNYNSLALQGLLIAGIAIVLIAMRPTPWAWVLLGLGGFLAFMAKPPTAVALAGIALLFLVLSRRAHWRGILLSSVTAMFLLATAAFLIDGSLFAFINRITDAMQEGALLQSGHTIRHLFYPHRLPLSAVEALLVGGLFVAAAGVTLLARWNQLLGTVLFAAACLIAAMRIVGIVPSPVSPSAFLSLGIPAALAGGILIIIIVDWRRALGPLVLSLILALLPFCYAFGTGNNFWATSGAAGVFWFAAATVLVCHKPVLLLPSAAVAFAAAVNLIFLSAENPYRQTQSLRQQTTVFEPLGLRLPTDFADYLTGLTNMARDSGFAPGQPIVDLTGHYPGAAYALGGSPLGSPWLIGGYGGSTDLARHLIGKVPCADLARAWVLIEPEGPRAISMAALGGWQPSFEPAGAIESPRGTYDVAYRQELLMPDETGKDKHDACLASRQ